jgi:hypothetical protein
VTSVSNASTATLPTDIKSVLEHVRTQFQYHATQRLNTIRYFFVAYAIFVAAYVGLEKAPGAPLYFPFVLSATALIITLGFWGLDVRNVQLVHVDERALEEIEELVSEQCHFKFFQMSKNWEKTPFSWLIRYRVIANLLFLVIALISALATVRDYLIAFCQH